MSGMGVVQLPGVEKGSRLVVGGGSLSGCGCGCGSDLKRRHVDTAAGTGGWIGWGRGEGRGWRWERGLVTGWLLLVWADAIDGAHPPHTSCRC